MKHILIDICTLVGIGGCRSNSDGAVMDNRTVQTFDVARFRDLIYRAIWGNGMKLHVMIIGLRRV